MIPQTLAALEDAEPDDLAVIDSVVWCRGAASGRVELRHFGHSLLIRPGAISMLIRSGVRFG